LLSRRFFIFLEKNEKKPFHLRPYQAIITPVPNSEAFTILRHLQALCVARHRFLAEHIARFFSDVGVDTIAAVGFDGAVARAHQSQPDLVVCEYDLLATLSLEVWEQDVVLSQTPVLAVSLTRHPAEMHPLDVNGIAGFLYLPTLAIEAAQKVVYAAATRRDPSGRTPPTPPSFPAPADTFQAP
jgi:hypothetical protein